MLRLRLFFKGIFTHFSREIIFVAITRLFGALLVKILWMGAQKHFEGLGLTHSSTPTYPLPFFWGKYSRILAFM